MKASTVAAILLISILLIGLVAIIIMVSPPTVYGLTIASQTFSATAFPSTVDLTNAVYATVQSTSLGATNTTSASALILGQHKGTTFQIWRYLSTFDTSTLGTVQGFSIINVTWCMLITQTDIDGANFSVTVQVRNATAPAAFPHQPLWKADYDYNNWTGNLGTYDTTLMTTVDVYYNITLNDNSIVSTSGNTYILARSSRDISATTPVGTYDEWIKIDNPLLVVFYSIPSSPQYDIATFGHSSEWAGQSCAFSLNWSSEAPLVGFYLETNNTGPLINETFTLFSGSTWSNKTITLNSTADIVIEYRFHANNTGNVWNNTGYFTFWTWRSPTPVSKKDLGGNTETARDGLYVNGTATGGIPAIYVAYLNSSFSPTWKMQVTAYDINRSLWLSPYTLGDAIGNDPHVAPNIVQLPDGRLVLLYGYGTDLYFRVSTYNASTTTSNSLNNLISNWGSEQIASSGVYSYPSGFGFSDRLLVFMRSSIALDGNFSYIQYPGSNNATLYSSGNTSRLTSWNVYGSTPYLDSNRSSGIESGLLGTSQSIGDFSFQDLADSLASGFQVSLDIYVENPTGSNRANVYLYNGSWYNVGSLAASAGWSSFNVTSYLNTYAKINNASIYFNHTADLYNPINISQARLQVNYTGWGKPTDIIYMKNVTVSEQSTYAYPARYGDNVLISFNSYVEGTGQQTGAFFCYSDDKGDTWKYDNGTSFTLPNSGWNCKVANISHFERNFPVLDNNNKPIIICKTLPSGNWSELNQDWKVQIAYSSAALGSTGTWTVTDALDQDGNKIYGLASEAKAVNDSFYGRPSFWCSGNQTGNYIAKYVLMQNESYKFKAVYIDTSEMVDGGMGSIIQNSLQAYEGLSGELRLILGNVTKGAIQENLNNTVMWGCKYVAMGNGTIDLSTLYVNHTVNSTSTVGWDAAIYNSSFQLLGNTSSKSFFGGNMIGWGWHTTSTSKPVVVQGQSYWVLFRVSVEGTGTARAQYYWNPSGSDINQTCIASTVWGDNFPATITPTAYFNRTISLVACPLIAYMRGIGVDEYATTITNTGANSTMKGAVCLFYTYAMDLSGLSFANFRSNNTGPWVNTTYSALSGTENWCNFTLTLNKTIATRTVTWEIWVNDTNNVWASTGTQYVTFTFTALAANDWTTFTPFTVDVGRTLGEINASLNLESITWNAITVDYGNGTQWSLVYGQEFYGEKMVAATSDTLNIWCPVIAEWWHTYP